MRELDYKDLRKFLRPDELSFETTKEIEPIVGMVGQERAVNALEFGLSVKKNGYNIYISGATGTGRSKFAKECASKKAAKEKIPNDICYVYNFTEPAKPKLLELPAGRGREFQNDMDELINQLVTELPKVFSEKEFENQKADQLKEFQGKRDVIIKKMTEDAKEQEFGVKSTNTGIYFMPIIEGEIITEEQYESLNQERKDEIAKNSEQIQRSAADGMRQIKDFEKGFREKMEDLEYKVGLFSVGYYIAPVIEKYCDYAEVLKYLQAVKEDILDNIEDFVETETEEEEQMQQLMPWYNRKDSGGDFAKYKVNLLVDNSGLKAAPVIVDYRPLHGNLVGEIEYDNEYGNLTTDFMKIKAGLLHRANGGYLILQAHDVLNNHYAWETLRQAFLTGEIVTEPIKEYTTGVTVSCIRPEPLKLDLKIIMIGDEFYFDILHEFDEAFSKMFKIKVEFDYEMQNNHSNLIQYAQFVKRFVRDEGLLEFDAAAVAKIIEYSTRLSESKKKLSTQFGKISEVLIEADTWAKLAEKEIVGAAEVKKAISEREYRLGLYEEKLTEIIDDGVIMIDVHGEKVGQINGLAVMETSDHVFAKPSRITATTYVGKAGIINIEKEAKMSGSIHEKGIQVLAGFLGQTYAQDFPLSLSCRVCFEQNYSGVDGDSASSTELYAVLSSLSELPINQEIAVTGSINQRGEIQAIGGVTYKIEGFFELCKKRGLTGTQGVIIPKQNVMDLALNDDVVEAVKDGMFHIYPIEHIDEGIEILTGFEAGVKNEKQKYPQDSVHGKVLKKLKDFYKKSTAE